ncbi:MAG: ligase-associated DNA damage response DEXH box helicase [Gammaproteobacteria bacterium]|jgi:ATP-dependent Lhr-like helicase
MAQAETDGETAIRRWFRSRGWTPLEFQQQTWDAYDRGGSGLVNTPTGSGKTLAVWGGPLATARAEADKPGLKVLWITPLRALARDTVSNLQQAADGLETGWRVDGRTGDTPYSRKNRQRQAPPDALVTTPESLSVMFSYPDTARLLSGLQCVVVDEWHELLGNKRGVQLELCLARLRHLSRGLRIWGLSATLSNLDQAMEVLLGGPGGTLITAPTDRPVRIRALVPETIERFPWGGHLGVRLLPQVLDAIEAAGSTLLFTNTRSQAELWYEAIIAARPAWKRSLALHHGSVDRRLRTDAEEGLAAGRLRCVVCTSSLDLGVDFSPVDQVIQVGSPKGVARLLQRAGRSGHQPGVESQILCVPTHAFELVEIAAARRAAEAGLIESRRPLTRALDVLAQHLVTLAVGGGFEEQALLREVRTSHAFRDLSDGEWRWVIDFVSRGGDALKAYPRFRKIVLRDGKWVVSDRRIATMHRMSIGTISSDAAISVRWASGGRLGTIEESFIARLRPGDRFLFAGRLLELVRIRDMTAWVRKARRRSRTVPRWQGGRMPLSTELADSVVALMARGDAAPDPEMRAVGELLEVQARWSRLPRSDHLLAERIVSREGHHLFLYPFAGRLVHEGLATLLAWRIARADPATFTLSFNDYGLELLAPEPFDKACDGLETLLSPDGLTEDLLECMNVSEIARRQFRDIARVAGLVFQGYPGRGKSARQLQASSGLIFDVLLKYDAGNLLVDQARREVMDSQLEIGRLRETLERASRSRLVLTRPPRLTPLAFPIWASRLQSQVISSEDWRVRVERAMWALEKAASKDIAAAHRKAYAAI